MAKASGKTFSRRAPDILTEELIVAFERNTSYEFKPLFDLIFANLRARNAASGGEEMLRLRCYEKLQSLVGRGAVKKTVNGIVRKYKGVALPLRTLSAEMKELRTAWAQRPSAKSAETP